MQILSKLLALIGIIALATISSSAVLFSLEMQKERQAFLGRGEVSFTPNVIKFSFSVSKESSTVDEASAFVTESVSVITDYLKNTKSIPDSKIRTSNYSIYPAYEFVGVERNRRQSGFNVTQSFSVTVENIDDISEILAFIGTKETASVYGIGFTIKEETRKELEKQAIQKALENAKENARHNQTLRGSPIGVFKGFSVVGMGGNVSPKLLRNAESVSFESVSFDSLPSVEVGSGVIVQEVKAIYER